MLFKRQYSVTEKIKETKQPRGGYLNPKSMEIIDLNDKEKLHNMQLENYHAATIGLAVDYLTRFMNTNNALDSFRISAMGANILNKNKEYDEYINNIKGLDDLSICSALKLCEFDVAFRAGPMFYNPNIEKPKLETIENIRNMVNNSLNFFSEYGPITKDGFVFRDANDLSKNGYSNVVSKGDGDFLTEDTMWDFKVSKNPPTKDHTLQLLMYFIMGKKSKIKCFDNIKSIGIYNPRLNKIYKYDVSYKDKEILEEIASDVIEYENTLFIENIF